MEVEWEVPHENRPAPRPLLLVQAFINTRDLEQGTDRLVETKDAHDWLTKAGLWTTKHVPSSEELKTARHVREALRQVLVANHTGTRASTKALRVLRSFAGAARLRIDADDPNHLAVVPLNPGMDAVLVSLLTIVRDSQLDGSWQRLKACANPECLSVFFDRSHSRQSMWCEMKVCGNRLKNRRYRQRSAH